MREKQDVLFCQPEYGKAELLAVERALKNGRLEGGGKFNRECQRLICESIGSHSVLITPSCTASLEMMALALQLGPGDEVIMPDFTFVSTANAFALRGATPVFVDIDDRTLNVDPDCVESAISPRTKAIVAVHYAGVACEMDRLEELCDYHNIALLEDAAQAYGSRYRGRALGSIGKMSAFSFHHTKNLSCGEGGAIASNTAELTTPLEWIQEKGTDRASFKRREKTKYEWNSLGSSYLLSEVAAAVLSEQLKKAEKINERRLSIWEYYLSELKEFQSLNLPNIPSYAQHNAHIFHLRLPSNMLRESLISHLKRSGISATSHYVPLHQTLGGKRYSRSVGTLSKTIRSSETLIRLPLHTAMTNNMIDRVIDEIHTFCRQHL